MKNMKKQFERTALLLGADGVEKLQRSRVAIFGVGGVGGYCAEALARAGVGELFLVDKDVVDESNINRQIVALHSTVGLPKAEVMRARIADINPDCRVTARVCFYDAETAAGFDFSAFDYVADAVDDVAAKTDIIARAVEAHIPVISAMGAGNKLFPEKFEVADISKTQVCPLARSVRRRLRERGVERGVKAVFSREVPAFSGDAVGSVPFVPSVMGLIMAGEIIKDLVQKK